MRAVIQRVKNAEVKIDNQTHAQVGQGLLIFVGIENNEGKEDIEWLCKKITNLRIFDDLSGVMNLSVCDIKGECLVVSQFTLHASTKKGNRPSYIKAAPPEIAIPVYNQFVEELKKQTCLEVKEGVFGADMQICLLNDGPVTILIDTKGKE